MIIISVHIPTGNWTGDGKFKLWFKSGGAIEFGQAMLRAGKLGKSRERGNLISNL